MHLTANIKVLTSGQMGTFLVSRSDLDAHVDRLVEVRQLLGLGKTCGSAETLFLVLLVPL